MNNKENLSSQMPPSSRLTMTEYSNSVDDSFNQDSFIPLTKQAQRIL